VGKLSDRRVLSAKVGRHVDGDGLMLIVSGTGSRKWVFRYQIAGARRDMGLGSYPAISLADARAAATEARKGIATGSDPIEARAASRKAKKPIPSFGDIAALVVEAACLKTTNAKSRYQWTRYLGPAYCGALLARPVNEITTTDLAAVLRPVFKAKPQVASKLYPAVRRVFEHARVQLRDSHGISMPDNPARWDDLKAMGFEPAAKLTKGHHPSLPYTRMSEFLAELRSRNAMTARMLEFLALTNIRTGAALFCRWEEFDHAQAVWTVPLANLKDRKHRKEGFRVPLAKRVLEILNEMQANTVSPFVFPGRSSQSPMSNMALLALVKRLNALSGDKWIDPRSGRSITPHGFRATFRTWAEELTGFSHAVVEEAMGHQIGSAAERSYRRTDVLERRRELMEAWSSWCSPKAASNIVPFAKTAGK
jgi:integrase